MSVARSDPQPPAGAQVVDATAWVGTYPFRHIPASGPADLDRQAQRRGIDRVIVSRFEDLFQQNALAAWPRRARALARRPRLEPWPVVNPPAAGELRRLEGICRSVGPRGLRLLPNYHGYSLSGPAVDDLMALAQEHGLVVQVLQRITDERQHWMLRVPPVPMEEMTEFAARHRAAAILLSAINGPACDAEVLAAAPKLRLDLSRMRGPVFALEGLLERVGAGRLVFGSLWPLQLVEATLWQVQAARIAPAERAAVLGGSFRALLDDARA